MCKTLVEVNSLQRRTQDPGVHCYLPHVVGVVKFFFAMGSSFRSLCGETYPCARQPKLLGVCASRARASPRIHRVSPGRRQSMMRLLPWGFGGLGYRAVVRQPTLRKHPGQHTAPMCASEFFSEFGRFCTNRRVGKGGRSAHGERDGQ